MYLISNFLNVCRRAAAQYVYVSVEGQQPSVCVCLEGQPPLEAGVAYVGGWWSWASGLEELQVLVKVVTPNNFFIKTKTTNYRDHIKAL